LTACFLFLAIVFTKQCWYCSQKFHIYALSSLHTASKLNVHLIVMCSKRLPLGIKFNSDSYFNPLWQYDWTYTGALLMGMHSKCLVMVMGLY